MDTILDRVRLAQEQDRETFAALVSNPPYQRETEGIRQMPVYQDHARVGYTVADRISMIHPSRWLFWRDNEWDGYKTEQFKSKSYRQFYDYPGLSDVFHDAAIQGGVCIYLKDKGYQGESIAQNGLYVRGDNLPKFIGEYRGLDTICSAKAKYGHLRLGQEVEFFDPNGSLTLVYIKPSIGVYRSRVVDTYTTVPSNHYKVFLAQAGEKGRPNRVAVGTPREVCSTSFIEVGPFESRVEAENCLRYIQTDLMNFMMYLVTPTQNIGRHNYRLIPIADFITGEIEGVGELDFTRDDLDEQLYKLFDVTPEQQEYIRSKIKPWTEPPYN